jgi:hypothetical protein
MEVDVDVEPKGLNFRFFRTDGMYNIFTCSTPGSVSQNSNAKGRLTSFDALAKTSIPLPSIDTGYHNRVAGFDVLACLRIPVALGWAFFAIIILLVVWEIFHALAFDRIPVISNDTNNIIDARRHTLAQLAVPMTPNDAELGLDTIKASPNTFGSDSGNATQVVAKICE